MMTPGGWWWLLFSATVTLIVAGLLWWAVWAYRRVRTRRALMARFSAISVDLLQDVLLPDGAGGWFHVDFLLALVQGLLVIDLRDRAGLIYGSEQMTEWTVMDRHKRSTFPNPLESLYDRLAVVKQLAGEGVLVQGRVVFTSKGHFPKGHPDLVVALERLADQVPARDPAATMSDRQAEVWAQIRAVASASPLKRR